MLLSLPRMKTVRFWQIVLAEGKGQAVPGANNNWGIAPITSKIDLNVTVETAPGKKEKLLQVKKRLHKAA